MATEVTDWTRIEPGDAVSLGGRRLLVDRIACKPTSGTATLRFRGNPKIFTRPAFEHVTREIPELSLTEAIENLDDVFDMEQVVYTWAPGEPIPPGAWIGEMVMQACALKLAREGIGCTHTVCLRGWL